MGPSVMTLGRLQRRGFALLAVLGFAVTLLVVEAGPASALGCGIQYQSDQEGYSTRFAGAQPHAIEGTRSTISNPGGFVLCSGDTNPMTNFSVTWDQISAQTGHAQAQAGLYYSFGDSCVRNWAEQTNTAGQISDVFNGCSDGQPHIFWNQAISGTGGYHMRSNEDQTILRQTVENPYLWPTPLQAAWDSETKYDQDNISGTASNPTNYTSNQVQLESNDSFVTTSNNTVLGPIDNNNLNRWSHAQPCCAHTQTWTN
jgi:hypothetical protein